jgi:hypothetical protein
MREICHRATNHRGRDPERDEEGEAWEAIRHGYNPRVFGRTWR